MPYILQTTFSNEFSSVVMVELWLNFTDICSGGPTGQMSSIIEVMDGHRNGDKPLPEPMMT